MNATRLALLLLLTLGSITLAGCTSGLRYAADPGWVAETPSSDSRIAQFRLPAPAGGPAGDPSLVIYHFGGGGAGNIDANIDRWCDQFEQPDGRASRDAASVSSWTSGGLTFYHVDVGGTYVAETFPGSGVRENKPGQRLLAAIVTTDDGPYYVKLVGPEPSVTAWKASFDRFLATMAWGPGGQDAGGTAHP